MDLEYFKGYKSYIVAVAGAMYAVGGWVAGYHDINYMITVLLSAGGFSALAAKVNRFFNAVNESELNKPVNSTSTDE